MVAMLSPAMTTLPSVTGTFSTRPGGRRQHLPFLDLRLDDRALRLRRFQDHWPRRRKPSGPDRRAPAGATPLALQGLRALELGLGGLHARLDGHDLRVERFDLEGDLGIGDECQHLARLDRSPLSTFRAGDRSRRAHAGLDQILAAHGRVDGFEVVDLLQRDGEGRPRCLILSRECRA